MQISSSVQIWSGREDVRYNVISKSEEGNNVEKFKLKNTPSVDTCIVMDPN